VPAGLVADAVRAAARVPAQVVAVRGAAVRPVAVVAAGRNSKATHKLTSSKPPLSDPKRRLFTS
jgi:hypothetical protein